MNILYVGFKGKNNASSVLLNNLSGNKLFLTNSFAGIKRDIDAVSRQYDLIIMFGIDKGLKDRIRIEDVASYDGEEVRTIIDTTAINHYFKDYGVESYVSDIPTAYLCNVAYFYMLKKYRGKAIFIHIPTCKNMSEERNSELAKLTEVIFECADVNKYG